VSDVRFAEFALDRKEMAERFAERVLLAKMTEEEAIAQTVKEWRHIQRWVASVSTAPGSFNYMCDVFDMEADAVRRAILERK
jgi:hypothetical protein